MPAPCPWPWALKICLPQENLYEVTAPCQQQQQPPKVASLRRAVSVPRDPQRVLRPTSAFMARLLPVTSDDAVPSSSSTAKRRPADSYILDIQSKSVFLVKNPLVFSGVLFFGKFSNIAPFYSKDKCQLFQHKTSVFF